MKIGIVNHTESSNMIRRPTFIWCFLMPSVHFFGLISNILCIIVFFSHTFIKKPIAIYFICLLMSDSITLFIGYIEMIDRETNMIDKSSWLCMFNEKIIHTLTDIIYTFMERFCLEWMLYKVLWTRASTILLAILSIQRTRTFFSLSYHETRLCAFFACIVSIMIALAITCLEWIGVQSAKSDNLNLYLEVFQSVVDKKSSNEFYTTFLYQNHNNYNESKNNYSCIVESLNMTDKLNCSSDVIASEFYSLTQSLLSFRDAQIVEKATNILTNIASNVYNLSNNSILLEYRRITKTEEFLPKLFENRQCYITLRHSFWLKTFTFLQPLLLSWNRHAVAIFFGNALPSFIVVLANLLSIKVIYFSKSLKYLKQTNRKNHRKRRLQNDLRAFLVILFESFSVIFISWAIPIFLTMYHCRTLYVITIAACPKIKDYLALFLFTDLFNSSTNCLLYSLSGKLFRRKFISIIKTILTCGRGTLWSTRQNSLPALNKPLDRQISNNPSTNTNNNFGIQTSRPGSHRHSERLSSPIMKHPKQRLTSSMKTTTTTTYKRYTGQYRNTSDDGSLSMNKTSDDQYGGKNSSSEIESDTMKIPKFVEQRKSSQSIKSYLLDKVRSLGSTSSASSKATSVNRRSTILTTEKEKNKAKKKVYKSIISKRQTTADLSLSSSSFSGSLSYGSQRKHSLNNRCSSKIILDNPSITRESIQENLTSL